ncbi:MAG: ABC transporter ATP-binding protein [Myxococcota bacterium]|nr:ABC transporter ATP-binding protein [Myxococcota bacterium]
MSAFLEARRLHLRHPGADHDSVRDFSIKVNRGEVLALLGPNGSGKSTLLRSLGRDLPFRKGELEFDGADILSYGRRELARRMARLPQNPMSPVGLTVEELVSFGRNPFVKQFSRPSRADQLAVEEALDAVSMSDSRYRLVETLSGGENRRAWLGMVLAQRPEILLLDEPTAALDLRHQWELLELLTELNRDSAMTIVLSIHDLEHAAMVAERVAVMTRGRLYAVGTPQDILSEETLLDVFRVHSTVDVEVNPLQIRVHGPGDPIRNL